MVLEIAGDILRSVPESVEAEEMVRPGQQPRLKLSQIIKIGAGAADKMAPRSMRTGSEPQGRGHKDKLGESE